MAPILAVPSALRLLSVMKPSTTVPKVTVPSVPKGMIPSVTKVTVPDFPKGMIPEVPKGMIPAVPTVTGSTVTNPTSSNVEGMVKYKNIIHAVSVLLKWISKIFSIIGYYIATNFYNSAKWCFSSLPLNIFMLSVTLVGVFCYMFADTLWKYAIMPSINGIIQGFNGATGVWNNIADSVAHIGFPLDFGTLGDFYVDLGGIPLPKAKEIDEIEKSFYQFCLDILNYIIGSWLKPVKEFFFR